MDEKTKEGIKRLTRDAERGIARSIIRWKYKKEGKSLPEDQQLDEQSRKVADTAHQVLSESGRNLWTELKKAYQGKKGPGEGSH